MLNVYDGDVAGDLIFFDMIDGSYATKKSFEVIDTEVTDMFDLYAILSFHC